MHTNNQILLFRSDVVPDISLDFWKIGVKPSPQIKSHARFTTIRSGLPIKLAIAEGSGYSRLCLIHQRGSREWKIVHIIAQNA